jgi:hypothetical protein
MHNNRAPAPPTYHLSMNIRHFVSVASILLTGWLGMTYFTEVPAKSYPVLGRGSVPLTTGTETLQVPNNRAGSAVAMSIRPAENSAAQ